MTIYLTPPVSGGGGGGGAVASGTTTAEGTVRLATTTEAQDVNNETLAVTPKGLNAQISAAVAGGVTYQGVIAGDSIPTLTSATQGDLYKISVASTGVVAGFNWAVNDNLLINADMGGTFDAAKVNKIDSTDSDLATVATSGSYNDLTNKPPIPSASTDLTDTASLVRTTDLATVATTGAYGDLTGQPTNLSQFNNDQNYITSVASASTTTAGIIEIADATETSAGTSNALAVSPLGLATEIGNLASTDLSDTASLVRTTDLETVATTGSYNDLSNKPTIPSASTDLTDGADLLKTSDKGTTIGDVVEVVDVGGSVAGISALDGSNLTNLTYANITGTPSLANVATSGDYNDLINTPSASAGYPVQTATSSVTANLNNAIYLTAASSTACTVTLPAVSGASDGDVVIIVRRSPGSVTIQQSEANGTLLTYLDQGNASSFTITNNQQQIHVRFDSAGIGRWYIFDKAQAVVATSGSYNDLTNKPTSDDITSDHTGVNYTGALNASITDHLSGIDNALSGLVSGLTYQGNFTLANPPANFDYASKGDFYKVVDSGLYYNQIWAAGDHLVVNNDMGGTINNGKIDKVDNTDVVTRVNGLQGNLTLNGTHLAASYGATNYTGTATNALSTHFSGIDNKFGTLGTASTNASTDFLSATGADSLGGNLDTNSHEIVTSANNDNITLRPNGTGIIKLGGSTNPAELRFYCETTDQHWVGLKAPTHGQFGSNPSVTWRLPITDAANPGDALVSDGSGNLSFTTISGGGGGGYSYSTETSNLTAQANYHYSCGAGDESFTIQLPTSGISAGSEIRIKNMGTGTITIDPQTREIDGSSNNYTLDVQFSAITLVSTGANWEII